MAGLVSQSLPALAIFQPGSDWGMPYAPDDGLLARPAGLSSRVRSRERHSLVAATDVRPKITLACQECKNRNYITRKNRRNDPDRLELMKYCPKDRKHTLHRETR